MLCYKDYSSSGIYWQVFYQHAAPVCSLTVELVFEKGLKIFRTAAVRNGFKTNFCTKTSGLPELLCRGFAPEAIVTSILFSFVGYYNGHSRTLFVMLQGIAQTFLVRLPMSYLMSIQPNASLTMIGLAAPCATVFGIVINAVCFVMLNRKNRKSAM